MRRLAAVFLFAAASARADALADLKHTLSALRGTAPLAASYDERHTNKAEGRFFTQNLNVHSVAEVRAADGGVTVTLSRAAVERLRAERTAEHRDDDGREKAGDVAAGSVAELLDFAPSMQAMLAHAVLLGERDAALGQTPARLLLFKVPPERSRVTDIKVETKGDDLSIWLGRDGVPLAAEKKASFSVGFLFLKAGGTSTDKWTFVRRDDRLVVVYHEHTTSAGGMGESSKGTETQSITLR